MKYSTILFDADGTLYDFDKAAYEAFKSVCNKYELPWSEEIYNTYEKVNKQIWDEFEEGKISASQIKTERFKRFFDTINVADIDPNKFSYDYLDFLSQNNYLYPCAADIVKWCYERFELVIVTNGLAMVQNRRFGNSELRKYFKHIIISEEVGSSKPNKGIFEHTFKLLNHKSKDDVIIIGDNLNSDIKGGVDFGIDTCWINASELENNSGIKPTFTIKKLSELKNILQ